jgi:hypothetical protein
LVVFSLALKRCKRREAVTSGHSSAHDGNSWLAGDGGGRLELAFPVVEVLAAHLCVFCNALLARFSAHNDAAHGKRHNDADGKDNGRSQHHPSAPSHVRHEEQNVNNKGND